MAHSTSGSKVYRLPVGGMIANMHAMIAAMRQGFANRKLKRSAQLVELAQCFPGMQDSAALENLLDGFYSIDEDGSVLVDNVAWGRRV